jgi:minor extracellular serine protease Vpr
MSIRGMATIPLRRFPLRLLLWFIVASSSLAQTYPGRYALLLDDPPVMSRFATREETRSANARIYRQRILARQQALRSSLSLRNIQVTGSVSTVLNAVFVALSNERAHELTGLPGVKGVVALKRYHADLNRAIQLVNSQTAWGALAGSQNAGRGLKIAILDTGIEQTHPAFQDASLTMPTGYPLCTPGDCAFTTNKVIVARSYVRQIAAGSDPKNPAADSRPDDYSARDRTGHGTAVASCAAGNVNTGLVTFSGVAPKAYLGNYKIYGSPQVNDSTGDDVIIQAVEDAFNDGMDIINFSTSAPAFTGPLDTGAICKNQPGIPCDLSAKTFEDLAKKGLIIVTAAGNYGDFAMLHPALNTIASPADAPSVIAVGSSTNSHTFQPAVTVQGSGIAPNLKLIPALAGDGPPFQGALTAPLRDATQAGNDGYGCSPFASGSLTGSIALIERGPGANGCDFSTKLGNAQNAGAVGVIFYVQDQSAPLPPGGLAPFKIGAVIVANNDGVALKNFAIANPDRLATVDPAAIEQGAMGNQVASAASYQPGLSFTSLGPSLGELGLKPELVAPGTNMYMAFETLDPLGDLYSGSGYGVAAGTSFSTALVSAAAALVKQRHPGFSAAQVKSALVNTASQDVLTDVSGTAVNVLSLGAGKLDVGAAVNSTVTCVPSTISFGALTPGVLPKTVLLTITNTGTGTANLTLALAVGKLSSGATLSIDRQNLLLPAGASGTVTAALTGGLPLPGSYYGSIVIQGSGVSLRVPYLYLVGDGVPANVMALSGLGFDGTVGEGIPGGILAFKLVDAYGVPAASIPVTFSAPGGGSLQNIDRVTDANGVAAATPTLGAQPGNYSFVALAGGLRVTFSGTARAKPNIPARSILNAASFDANSPIAPGSYISIFGTGLGIGIASGNAVTLPLALNRVTVSFDVPSAGISVPGHLVFVSPGQVNLQVPWELQGQSVAQVKVSVNYSRSNVVTASLSDYSPAFFEGTPGVVAALDATSRLITAANPARGGQTVELFANGLGPVTNQPASGDPAPSSVLAETKTLPTITIGGQTAAVAFSGLAPGFPGLYQVNVVVPPGLSPGVQPIDIAIGGRTSKASGIAVQ